jgi:hypothetical protein
MVEHAGEDRPIIGAVGQHPNQQAEGPCFRHLIPSLAFDTRFDVPNLDVFIQSIRNYCRWGKRGPLGNGEIVLTDRNGRQHEFDFETFYNGYDALTLGVHRCAVEIIVAI